MEFHADAVAAGVSGSNNLVSALSRIEVAGNCYATALSDANDRLKENKVAQNIFINQLTVLRSLASEYKLPVRQGLPEVSYHFIQSFPVAGWPYFIICIHGPGKRLNKMVGYFR